MRVLSLHQPFAQLVVRGVKRVEVRSWTTSYRGRIAIHAKGVAPSQEIESRWRANRDLALRLADEGWLDREDLKKLPRSAIIGTVNLTGIARGSDQRKDGEDASGLFAWNPVTKWFELATRDKRTGELRPRYSPMRPLPVTFKPDDYLWAFGDAVEIEPVEDVPGKQNLWHLDDALSAQVARREAQSLSGEWERPPVSQKRREESIRVWRGRHLSDLEREAIKIEETVLRGRELQALLFARPFEFKFQRVFMDYVDKQGTHEVAGVEHVRLDGRLRTLCQGREWMPVDELELEVRRYFKTELARQAAAERQQRHRKLLMQWLLELRKEPPVLNSDGEVVPIEVRLEHKLHALMDEEEGIPRKRTPKPEPRRRTPAADAAAQDGDDPRGQLYEWLEVLGIDDSEVFYTSRALRRPPGRRKETTDSEDDA
jgi:ASCH domain-containing protein